MGLIVNSIFLNTLKMSMTASAVVIAVIIARIILKKAPKKYSYYLWTAVGLRLVCPVAFSSRFSLFQIGRVLKKLTTMNPVQSNGENMISGVEHAIRYPAQAVIEADAVKLSLGKSIGNLDTAATVLSSKGITQIASLLWLLGIIALLLYSVFMTVKLSNRLKYATKYRDNIYGIEGFDSPFVFGLIRPRIYLPYSFIDSDDEVERGMVLNHEKNHLRRKDHLVKAIAFALLCFHWFNPVLWLAFYLFNKDMEMSCDEMVISNLDSTKAYSMALLNCASEGKILVPSPVSFAESSIKSRIKNVLNYRKANKLTTLLAALVCVVVLAACATDSKDNFESTVETITSTDELVESVKEDKQDKSRELVETEETLDEKSVLSEELNETSISQEELNETSKMEEDSQENKTVNVHMNDVQIEKSPFYALPVVDAHVSWEYGEWTDETGEKYFNNGIYFACPEGTPVTAICDGVVTFVEKDYAHDGLSIQISQSDGFVAKYDHLSQINVSEGDRVTTGDEIAFSGATGAVTGPCLKVSVMCINGMTEDGTPFYTYVEPFFEQE